MSTPGPSPNPSLNPSLNLSLSLSSIQFILFNFLNPDLNLNFLNLDLDLNLYGGGFAYVLMLFGQMPPALRLAKRPGTWWPGSLGPCPGGAPPGLSVWAPNRPRRQTMPVHARKPQKVSTVEGSRCGNFSTMQCSSHRTCACMRVRAYVHAC